MNADPANSMNSLTTFPFTQNQPLINTRRQEKKCSTSRVLTNIVSPLSLIGASILLSYEAHKQTPDPKILTACYLDIGICARALLQANLPKSIINVLHNSLTRWSFELYEVLWNWYLNTDDEKTKVIILNIITAIGGFHLTGDLVTAINLKKGDRPERSLAELDLDAPIVNKILGPDYNNKKWQLTLRTTLGLAGIGLAFFGYIQDTSLRLLCISLGLFLSSHTVGFFGMESILWALKKAESTETPLDLDAVEGLNVSFKKKVLRTFVKVIPRFAVEGVTLLSLATLMTQAPLPLLCIPVGALAGAAEYHNQREFQILTPAVYEARKRENFVADANGRNVMSTALKVDFVFSGAWLCLFLGFFIYGILTSPTREQGEIVILIVSASVAMAIALYAEFFFTPGKEGRVVNSIRYTFLHNFLPYSLIYFGLRQLTAIDDQSLKFASPGQYACGSIALALLGLCFVSNRIQYISFTRTEPAFTPPLYRIEWIKTVVLRSLGRL